MSTRYLIAALLMTSACVAHADVTPSSASSSGFLSTWTTGNGADVVGSGVLSDNASLIGGVAHGADSGLTESLYQKASANAAQTGGVVKISYSQGIAGNYFTSTSNAVLLAMLGDNLSAVRSPDGAIISSAAKTSANMVVPSGAAPVVSSGGGTNNGGTNNGGISNGGTNNGGTNSGGADNAGTSNGGTNNGGTNSGGNNNDSGLQPTTEPIKVVAAAPLAQADAANVPEPSSIALLAAGMLGALGLRLRSKR